MTVYTEEMMAVKIAVSLLRSLEDELDEREIPLLVQAEQAIRSAEKRLIKANEKQARYMAERRKAVTA